MCVGCFAPFQCDSVLCWDYRDTDDTAAIDQLPERCTATFSSDTVLWNAQSIAS